MITWFRDALTANLGLKSVCFLLALVLVSYQRSQEEEITRTIEVVLDVQLPPAASGRELMTTLPPSLKVAVQGSSTALDTLSESTPAVNLDLRDGSVQQVRFEKDQIEVPPRVSVTVIEPATLELEWQDIISRRINVQSSVTGLVADGFEVHNLTVDPGQVALRGPARLVRVTQFVRVAPFDVTGLSEGTFDRQLALDPPPNRTSYVGASSVTVKVEVRRRLFVMPFQARPVEVVGIPGARTTPARVDVTVKGPPDVVKALSEELVVPRVDLSGSEHPRRGSKVVPVTVDLRGAEAEVQPPTVKVRW